MDRSEKALSEQFEQALVDDPAAGLGPSSLVPLVGLAVELRQGLKPAAPSAEFTAHARTRLIRRLAPSGVRRVARPRLDLRRVWQPALAGLVLIGTLLGGGLGVAHAAADALPGEPLYGTKRGLEQLQLALTSATDSQASLRVRFASERLQEAEALLSAGREAEVNSLLAEYQSEISAVVGLAQQSSDAGRVHGLQQALAAQEQALTRFLERSNGVGEQAAGAAIEEARHSQAVLQTLLEGGSPSDQAPGQLRRGTETPDAGAGQGQGRGQGQGGGRGHRIPTPAAP